MILRRKSRAGAFAERRYQRGLHSWRVRNRGLLAAILGPFAVAGSVVGLLDGQLTSWFAGVAFGFAITLWLVFRETPPRYVETWREGAEGERRAEKALRPLEQTGWRIFHDVQNGHGNYDHIAVGPAGVYLLESKNLLGVVHVKRGVPHLTRRHDPDETLIFDRIPSRALAGAASLKREIEQRSGRRPWVHAVVVFWSEFPDGFVQYGKCAFIEGSRLRDWLQSRPDKLSRSEIEEISAAIESSAGEAAAKDVASVPPEFTSVTMNIP